MSKHHAAGPHATPDQKRAAEKRREAAGIVEGEAVPESKRSAPPVERRTGKHEKA